MRLFAYGNVAAIVEKVRRKLRTPYRPNIELVADLTDVKKAVIELMIKCWEDNPSHRPTFVDIRHILIKAGYTRHVFIVHTACHSCTTLYVSNLIGV